jgi:formylglycine-generating enzyme required for sulfatase activity
MVRFLQSVAMCLALAACSTTDPPDARSNWTEPATGMAFRRIDPGTFVMGSPTTEPGREAQERQHRVHLTRPIWIGVFEVTQSEWQSIMGSNPSHWRDDTGRLPVEEVTWLDVRDFLSRLESRSPGNVFRLPSEAEWEYACRAGTATAYGTGASLTLAEANYAVSAERAAAGEGRTRPVGSFAPNAWGLHDMHGNVWEWVEDCSYDCSSREGPIVRGGAWQGTAHSIRSAARSSVNSGYRDHRIGFRIARID